jgi:hypothetical protein
MIARLESHESIRTMTAQPFAVSRQDRTQPLNVVGEHITVLDSAAQTGSYEIFFQGGPEGSGPHPTTTRGMKRSTCCAAKSRSASATARAWPLRVHSCRCQVAQRTGSDMGEAEERCSR